MDYYFSAKVQTSASSPYRDQFTESTMWLFIREETQESAILAYRLLSKMAGLEEIEFLEGGYFVHSNHDPELLAKIEANLDERGHHYLFLSVKPKPRNPHSDN